VVFGIELSWMTLLFSAILTKVTWCYSADSWFSLAEGIHIDFTLMSDILAGTSGRWESVETAICKSNVLHGIIEFQMKICRDKKWISFPLLNGNHGLRD
jgi:hypothetical protein